MVESTARIKKFLNDEQKHSKRHWKKKYMFWYKVFRVKHHFGSNKHLLVVNDAELKDILYKSQDFILNLFYWNQQLVLEDFYLVVAIFSISYCITQYEKPIFKRCSLIILKVECWAMPIFYSKKQKMQTGQHIEKMTVNSNSSIMHFTYELAYCKKLK